MRAVIFDMDGLMFDTESVFVKAWDYAGEQIGIGKAGYMTAKTLGMSIKASKNIWIEEFGRAFDEDALKSHTKLFLKEYYAAHSVPVKKGLYHLLSYLKQESYLIAVASSSPRWEVEHHLKGAEVFEYFDEIVCGDMVSKSKPDPEIYSTACRLLGRVPGECIALEDSKNGLLSAVNAGLRAIMVPDLWQPDEEIKGKVLAVLPDLDAVKEYLQKELSQ